MRLRLFLMATGVALAATSAMAADAKDAAQATLTGQAAYGDWRTDAPGVTRKITPADLDLPMATPSKVAFPTVTAKPADAHPVAPAGFAVAALAHLDGARQIRVAPNGDLFVSQTTPGKIAVIRPGASASDPVQVMTFAEGLDRPFGIAFYPRVHPKWVYVANTDSVVRFPYQAGDAKAQGPAEVVIAKLVPKKQGHSTRDIVFSADERRMFISVGSGSDIAEQVEPKTAQEIAAFAATAPLGADWGLEAGRADVLSADPTGKDLKIFATGIRNCVSMAVQPGSNALWCVTNERDLLGDNLPPDYVTTVKPGAFYGWPWYYIGAHEDPRPHLKGVRPDLADKVTTPDVLLQPHSAPLGVTFYTARTGAAVFPAAYQGQAFVALHGSWNRSKRTGYKIVRLVMKDGRPTGEYQDFVTGFVADDNSVWGRPVGVAVAQDGAVVFSDDASNTIWRVSPSEAKR